MKIVEQEVSDKFYNLTIEDKNGVSSMFVTRYIPTEYWLNNKDEAFRGSSTSKKVNTLTQYTEPSDIFDGDIIGGNNNHDLGVGVGGGGGGSYSAIGSPYYPLGCNGIVIVSIQTITVLCTCNGHLPGQCNLPICPNPGYYVDIPYYYCQEYPNFNGTNPSNPDDPSNPGGSSNNDNPEETSITAMIKPEECSERLVGDLNGDCMLSRNELCLLNGYSQEICECVSKGGNTDTCAEFLEILEEEPEARLDRFLELQQIITNNPWALIENCAAQNGLATASYEALYHHTMPPDCIVRLLTLGPDYRNQPLSAGNVPCANIDYYGVEITNLPDFNHNGQDDTSSEIYQAFRNKFTDLASGSKPDFQFSCAVPGNPTGIGSISWEFTPYSPDDEIKFTSTYPISAILNIEASASGIGSLAADDGAIMVTGYEPRNWTISTITTPYNDTQPFSGNRQWGLLLNQDGRLEIYTKAVDVARISTLLNIYPPTTTECQQDTYYNVAEVSWKNMQEEIASWINNNGGHATVKPSTAVRVKKEDILSLLRSNETISQIITNCN